jgi:chromosome segregation protein
MLKSLEIFGFKSFADRIRFDFAPGTTGVVGPNGSGKSNVVDSIKWILGDQSAKSLRGKEMTDVIFNGASGRKPSAFAEATLTFDNASGFLPVDSAEVQIGRRLSRNGEGEYFINRAPARLKDVRDLFMGTGAGSSTYCIIEQGRVEQILQANASARRAVFEEAAGISRYKSRKLDAERKLERVDQNVARLTDIVDEVEAQLTAIRSQAVKAAKYRQISEQLRELWLGLAADQYREHSGRLAEVEAQLAVQNSTGAGWDSRIAEIQSSLGAVEAEIARLDERLREVDGRRSDLREESGRHESTVRHQSSRVRELEADLVRLRRQRTSIESRGRDAAEAFGNAQQQAVRLDEELAARGAVLAERAREAAEVAAEVTARRQALEAERQGLLDKHRELTEASHRQSVLNTQGDELRHALSTGGQRRVALDQRIEQARAESTRRNDQVTQAAAAAQAQREVLDRLEDERLKLAGVQDQYHKTLADRREQRSAWRARKSVLEDLESRQEGLGVGVREILSRATTTKVAPWNHVIGSVADLFEVDLEWAPLIEIALGRRSEAIVVDDLAPFLDYVSRTPVPLSGRVGFIPAGRGAQSARAASGEPARTASGRSVHRFVERLAADAASRIDLRNQPGVECRADSLVRSSPQVPALAEQLLADVWIVDTADTAFSLAAGAGRGCRFVTLQGELIETDGTLTVGALRGETALVSQKSELRRLRQDLVRIDRQIQEDEERCESILASLGEADSELQAARLRLDEVGERHAASKREADEQHRELEQVESQLRVLDETLHAQEVKLEQTLDESQQAALAFAQLDGQIQASRQRLSALETELANLESRSIVVARRQNAEQLEIAKHEERRDALRLEEERLEREQRQFRQQSEEADRRVQQVLADRRRISLHILNTNAALAECCVKLQDLSAEAARLGAEKDALRKERAGLMKEESALSEERRRAGDLLHQLELQVRELGRERDSLVARIDEEYQVRLPELVESGVSAVSAYAAQNQAETAASNEPAESTPADSTESGDTATPSPAPTFADVREGLEAQVNRLRRQLKAMGSVNTESLHDLDEMETRFTHLSEQLADLVEAKKTLEEILRRISAESTRLFAESFQSIRAHFQELFRKFFGGGEGDVVLENPEDLLECGIEIVARPPGKELRSLSLLSGGEKTLTAVALLLAIFKSRPSPFCILDEVDAALDEANVERFAAVLREFKQTTQFIMITHSKRTMSAADLLYGVTMEESGVSKRLSVRFEDVDENGAIRGADSSAQRAPARRGRDAA